MPSNSLLTHIPVLVASGIVYQAECGEAIAMEAITFSVALADGTWCEMSLVQGRTG